ncbi:hypothetical protein SK128_012620, partial [Halocaridina rubra]
MLIFSFNEASWPFQWATSAFTNLPERECAEGLIRMPSQTNMTRLILSLAHLSLLKKSSNSSLGVYENRFRDKLSLSCDLMRVLSTSYL